MVGKICPNPYVYNTEKHTWQAFKEAVEKSNIKEAGIIANADGGMQIQKIRILNLAGRLLTATSTILMGMAML